VQASQPPAGDIPDLLSELVEDHATSEPKATKQAGSTPANPVESPAVNPQTSGERDVDGTIFDERIHYRDESGRPKKTATGKFRKRRSDSPYAGASTTSNTGSGSSAPSADECVATGAVCAQVLFTVTQAAFGPEWKPDDNEAQALPKAFADYFRATGALVLPPWVPLLAACGMYAIPRLNTPNTQNKLRKWMGKPPIQTEVNP